MGCAPNARNLGPSALTSWIWSWPMQHSSETIGAIAAALAKAQIDLINPEKSLTATSRSPFPHDADRSFRYASLANGLDLVCKHRVRLATATVQPTSIENETGMLQLTTT